MDNSYAELKAALKARFITKRLVIPDKYRFYKQDQHKGESIALYLAELRRLAHDCYLDALLSIAN